MYIMMIFSYAIYGFESVLGLTVRDLAVAYYYFRP
jgi:hypothetical protein